MNFGGNDVEVKFGGSTTGLDSASNKAVADVKRVGNSSDETGRKFGNLRNIMSKVTGQMKTGFQEASNEALSFGSTSSKALGTITEGASEAGAALGAVAIALAALAIPIMVAEWGRQFGELAEQIEHTSAKLGMSTREVSQWNAMSTLAGMDTDAFAKSGQRLERALVLAANGGKTQSAMFKALDIDITKTKTTSALMLAISDKFATMADGPKKTAIAMGLMGRAGANMIPILNGGSKAIKEQMNTAEEYGAVVSDQFMEAGLQVDEANKEMTLGMQGLKNVMFEALAPAIIAVVNAMNQLIKEMVQSYKTGGAVYMVLQSIGTILKILITIVLTVGTVLYDMYKIAHMVFSSMYTMISSVATAMGKFLTGDYIGAARGWSDSSKAMADGVKQDWADMGSAANRYSDAMAKMWGGPSALGAAGSALGPKGAGDLGDLDIPGMGNTKKEKKPKDDSKKKAEDALRDYLEGLDYKIDMARDNYEEQMRLEQQKLDALKAMYGEDGREYVKELRNKTKMERDHAQEVVKLEQAKIETLATIDANRATSEMTIAEDELQANRDHIDALVAAGDMGYREELGFRKKFYAEEQALALLSENTQYGIKAKSLRDQLALENLRPDERRRLDQELEILEAQHQNNLSMLAQKGEVARRKLNDQTLTDMVAKWQNKLQTIGDLFGGFLTAMVNRTSTFKQALVSTLDQITSMFISMGIKMLVKWVATQLGMSAAHKARVVSDTAAEVAGTGATTAAHLAAAATTTAAGMAAAVATTAAGSAARVAEVLGLSAVAAAAAFASIAAIPVVGPPAAPAAAAAAGAAVAAMAPAAAAAGGYDIPSGVNPIVQTHAEEMILPSKYANPLRDLLLGPRQSDLATRAASAGSMARSEVNTRGGDNSFHYNPQYHKEEADLGRLLEKDGRHMIRWMEGKFRDGAIKVPKRA